MKILVKSKKRFINPWTKNGVICNEPFFVPYDNLCRSYLKDGSLERVVEKKIVQSRKEPVKNELPAKETNK